MPRKESFFSFIFKKFTGSFAAFFGFFLALFLFFAMIGYSMNKSSARSSDMLPMCVTDAKTNLSATLSKTAPIILQIDIEGVIGKGDNPAASGRMIDQILLQPEVYGISQDRIKGILINVNSPGGGVYDSDCIYESIMAYKAEHELPVHCWTHNLCCSGGYYIACTSDHISADRVTIIGSVGVITPPKFNFYGTMQKYGVEQKTLSAGKSKEKIPMFSPMPKTDASYKDYKVIIDNFYTRFVDIVAKARSSHGLTKDKLRDLGATVYDPCGAKKLGYIDEANVRYPQAVEHMCKALEIDEIDVQILRFKHKESFIHSLRARLQTRFAFLFGDDRIDSLPITYEMN